MIFCIGMKSQELHRHLRASLGPWFREQGFRTAKRTPLGWHRDPFLIWIQCDAHGWDQYTGGSFFFNVQSGGAVESWGGPTDRLQKFLTDDELEEMRAIQNGVIPKLKLPPREFIQAMRSTIAKTSSEPESLIDSYLSFFKPVEQPFRRNHDVSLRYWDADDVAVWGAFILRVLPRIVADS